MHDITPETFLNTIFPPLEWGQNRVIYSKRSKDDRWKNVYYHNRGRIPVGVVSTYYCVSTVQHNSDYPRRGRDDVREAWVVVLDDIGTKAETPPLKPSYIIETSPDNYQYGYLIEPYDVSTPEGRHAYDTVVYSLIKAGYSDPGCRSATRVVRMPGSYHYTHEFTARITAWHPRRIWELEDLLPAMGVEPVEPASGGEPKPGKHKRLEDVSDPVYDWLVDRELVWGSGDVWVHMQCPWVSGHTDGKQGPTSTGYSPLDYGYEGRQFKCFHGHCDENRLREFLDWVVESGGPDCSNALQANQDFYRNYFGDNNEED